MVAKLIGDDRYLLNDIPGTQRTQRAFNSAFASNAMKPWCHLLEDDPAEFDSIEDPQRNAEESSRKFLVGNCRCCLLLPSSFVFVSDGDWNVKTVKLEVIGSAIIIFLS